MKLKNITIAMTPEKFNKIVNKLPKDKTELAKVELSFANDLKKALNSLKGKVKKGAALESGIEKQAERIRTIKRQIKTRCKCCRQIS